MPTAPALWTIPLLFAACGEVRDDRGVDAPPSPTCGDGAVDADELCDDGNTADGDGCSASCVVEACLVPMTYASIQAAVDDAACATVSVAPGTYLENVMIARDVTLAGAGAQPVILDGQARGSVVTIASGTVAIENMTIRNGRAPMGGGIANHGTLTLRGVRVDGNTASVSGGGVYSRGGALVLASTIVRNNHVVFETEPRLSGAGVYLAVGTLDARDSTIEANDIIHVGPVPSLMGRGAGIASPGGDVVLTRSRVASNKIQLDGMVENPVARGAGVYLLVGRLTSTDSLIQTNTILVNGRTPDASGAGVHAPSIVATDTFIDNNTIQIFCADFNTCQTTGGGGLYLFGPLGSELMNSGVTSNEMKFSSPLEGTRGSGGGILYEGLGNLTITGTEISGNKVTGLGRELSAFGGGIAWRPDALGSAQKLVINQSALSGNTVESEFGFGGALSVALESGGHQVRVFQSTLDNNRLSGAENGSGGGIYVESRNPNVANTVSIVSSTISGNTLAFTFGAQGAALRASTLVANTLRLNVISTTITANQVTIGGGTSGTQFVGPVHATFKNSILSANGSVSDCANESNAASLFSPGVSVFGRITQCTFSGGNDRSSTTPNLAALATNGGPTRTHAPLAGSPAIDAGHVNGCTDEDGFVLMHDQRGLPRTINGRCDIGAVER